MTLPTTLVPGVYLEAVSDRLPTAGEHVRPTLIVGQMTSAATATANVPYKITSAAAAWARFGAGSELGAACAAFLRVSPTQEIYAVGIDDAAAGTAAVGTLQVTSGPSSSGDGTIYLYIAGQLVEVTTTASATADATATAVKNAIAAVEDSLNLPVTATVATDTVTLTARHAGTIGNQIDIRVNYLGADGGQELPDGVALTIVQPTGGATDPTLDGTTALSSGTDEYDWIVLPWFDSTTLANWQAVADAYWGPTDQRMPYVITATDAARATAETAADGRNAPHETLASYYGSPTPAYEIAAAVAAVAARELGNRPTAPLTGQPLTGVLAPERTDRAAFADFDSMLDSGLSTVYTARGGGTYVQLVRATYKTDSSGGADRAWQSVQRSAVARRILRRIKARLLRDLFDPSKPYTVVSDSRQLSGDALLINSAVVKGVIIAEAADMVGEGLIEDLATFKAGVTVTRDLTAEGRFTASIPVDQGEPLRIVAGTVRFTG